MREIKFRGIPTYGKDFVYGSLIININEAARKEYLIKKHIGTIEIIPKTLGQYTGLKDKNGVEIYEGDICRCWGGSEFNGHYEYNKIYEVKWQGSGFEMMIDDCGYGWNYSSGFEYIEVIGNIYQNKELLQ